MGIGILRNGRPSRALTARIVAARQAVVARQQREQATPSHEDTPADPSDNTRTRP
jgi:hypothetical protein